MSAIRLHIAADHPAFAGHFPGQPLLPGVSLLAEVLEAILDDAALAAIVGDTPRIGAAKFLAPVRPGATLSLQLDSSARGVRFEARDGERIVASGQFEAARSGPSAGPPQAGPHPLGGFEVARGGPSAGPPQAGPHLLGGSIAVPGDRGAP